MHISPHLNYTISSSIATRIAVTGQAPETNPYALDVVRWMERNSPLCQSVMGCLHYRGIPRYYREDIPCKPLHALFSSLRYPAEREPCRDDHVLRFDRLAAIYAKASGIEQQEIDKLFICLMRLSLPELLENHATPEEPDLTGLALRKVDHGFGEEQEAYCEYKQEWVPAHLIPYRFGLNHGTNRLVADDNGDPQVDFNRHALLFSTSLAEVLASAVKARATETNTESWIQIDFYGQDILMAAAEDGGPHVWRHPLEDSEEFPAYWHDEYPFDLDKLWKSLLEAEAKAGFNATQDHYFSGDLGL